MLEVGHTHGSCRRPIGRNRDHSGDRDVHQQGDESSEGAFRSLQQDPRLDVNKLAFNVPDLMHLMHLSGNHR